MRWSVRWDDELRNSVRELQLILKLKQKPQRHSEFRGDENRKSVKFNPK